jgi:exosome complex component RRP42
MLRYFQQGLRYDNRKFDQFREVTIEYNISKNAEGSARVKIGETEVMAGVKMAIEKPYPDTPDAGVLMVGAELLPLSSPDFEAGPPSDQAIEIARVVDRGIRESETLDVKKLSITSGEKVWAVLLDIVTINDAGNLLDASGLASIAALQMARFPAQKDGKVDYKNITDHKLALKHLPIPITVVKIGSSLIVDPTVEEEEAADAWLVATSIDNGELCAMQKGGTAGLTPEEVSQMVQLAITKGAELRSKLKVK